MTDPRRIILETRAAAVLKEQLLGITDDEETLRDTIQGATNLHEAIRAVFKDLGEDEILSQGLSVYMAQLQLRTDRIKRRIDKRRNAIQKAMEVGEIRSVTFPEGTLSLRNVAAGLDVLDERKIPAKYWKPQDPKLDRALLKEDLKKKIVVDGARLDNGGISLSVRRG